MASRMLTLRTMARQTQSWSRPISTSGINAAEEKSTYDTIKDKAGKRSNTGVFKRLQL